MSSVVVAYRTLRAPSEGLYKEKGSKFHAYAYSVTGEADIEHRLEEVRKLHPKARHHCYAWRLGTDGNQHRANDDGEPSGTAGRPIYGQLLSHDLTDVLVVVVRYFGGTKLGASGLIHAYKTAADDALSRGEVRMCHLQQLVRISFDYARMGDIMNALHRFDVQIVSQDYDPSPMLVIGILIESVDTVLTHLKAAAAQVTLDEAARTESVDSLLIESIQIAVRE